MADKVQTRRQARKKKHMLKRRGDSTGEQIEQVKKVIIFVLV